MHEYNIPEKFTFGYIVDCPVCEIELDYLDVFLIYLN
jgi:hypothetical protein